MLLKTFFFAGLFFCMGSAKEVNILYAQLKSLSFERLSVENGLSSNIINGMVQDREGFYWFATVDGLNRFDGTSVKIFRHNKQDTTSISHNNCNAVIEGADGDIWVATMRGVCRYQKKTGVFRRYFFHRPDVNDDVLNRTYKLTADNEGNIWATSYGIWKIDPAKNSLVYLFDEYDSTAVSDGPQAHYIYFDTINKGLWFSTPHNLNFLDIATKKIYHPGNNPKGWAIFQKQNKGPLFIIDKTGKVWWVDDSRVHLKWFVPATGSGGTVEPGLSQKVTDLSIADDNLLLAFYKQPALVYNLRRNQTDTMPQPGFSNASPLSRNATFIYFDRNNNTWFRTAEGAYSAPQVQKGIKTYFLGEDATGYPYSINSIVKQKQILWLSVNGRLYQYNYVEQKLKPVYNGNLAYPVTYVLYSAGDSVLWMSSGENIILLNQKTNRIVSVTEIKGFPYFIACVNQKKFWVGTWDEGLYELDEKGKIFRHYTTKDGMPFDKLISYYYDGKNELWVGMNGGKGFSRLDLKTKKWANYLITSKGGAIESNTINAIVKDTTGNLWLGTYGGGLYYFDRKASLFQNYRQSDGLSGDYINTLALDNTGNLWISTSNGIDFIDVQSRSIFHINKPGQLYTDHVNNLIKSGDGTFFYAIGNEIISINPAQYIQSVSETTILISGFKIFDREMPQLASPSPVKLSYRQNFFTVDYSALKVSPDIPAQYAYRLEGLDKDWNYVGNRGVANYTNVPPGTYRLLLNATNETGRWNRNPVSLTITIVPPFWETWWFYTLSGIVISFIVIFSIRTRLNLLKKRQQEQLRLIVATQEKEKKNISAGLHDDLGVRLSALKYFVTSLKNHLVPNNPQAKETYNKTLAIIDESVEDIRYMLISLSPKTLHEYGYIIAVEDLINKLSRLQIIHISLKQKGMETRLHPEVEAGLYRITQELINNALKHAEAGSISLNIEKINGMIQLRYTDDGKGFELSKSKQGYGLDNIHARVALLNGKIEWQTAVNQSTNVLVSIPYNHP